MPQFDDETANEILDGGHDASLDELVQAIKMRRETLGRHLFAELQPGDQVRIVAASKKYLRGATAEVVEKRVTKVTIEFPSQMGQFDPYNKFAGRRWIFPVEALEKVNS